MRIIEVESLRADGGGRTFDFLKVTTDTGDVGWSEYNESFGGVGVSAVIGGLARALIGQDPRAYASVTSRLSALRRPASGGLVQQAIGAIENALLDLKARALGIPVFELFGGPVRHRIPLYWSHCGLYRVLWPNEMCLPALRGLDDLVALGRDVAERGFRALKANVLLLDDEPRVYAPGFGGNDGFPDMNPDRAVIRGLREQLEALREGAGDGVDLLVDLNFNFKTEGFLSVADAIEDLAPAWIEIDTRDAAALALIRGRTSIPIASCECLFGRREFRPFFEQHSMDVAIVDVPMNGLAEAMNIASMADAYEINVAPHNFYSPLATMMSAHFCAAIPNLRILEIDMDVAPWYDDLVTQAPMIESGELVVPSGPGWGTEVDEAAVRAHAPSYPNERAGFRISDEADVSR
jgi:L-alanine-DL-glutamate epimerase-like enolase superfamily enzyme